MGWRRTASVALAMGLSLFFASPAAAQDDTDEPAVTVLDDVDEAQPESQIVLDEDTSAIVHRIRRNLVIIAGAMTAALVVFVWHTNPSRRLRVATARAATADEPPESPGPGPN